MLHRIAVDMMRPPQSLSKDTVSSDVARARKVRRCISWVRTVLIACGDKAARVKYWSFFYFALTHKRYRQKTYVDKLHHSRRSPTWPPRSHPSHGTGVDSCFDLTSCVSPATKTPLTASHTIHHFDHSVCYRRRYSPYHSVHLVRRTLFARAPRPTPPARPTTDIASDVWQRAS
jgi:hypothetical protein